MIDNKAKLKDFLTYEGKIYGFRRPLRFLPRIKETSIVYKFLCLYRFEEYHFNAKHKLRYAFYHYLRKQYGRKLGIVFDGLNMIDRGVYIPHIGEMLIRAKRIGKNSSLLPGVRIITGNDGGLASIGDDVAIGVGVTIVGGVTIANGIAVGANALVCKSFDEEGITIAGNPAKRISTNGSRSWGGFKRFPDHWAKE